MTEQADSRLIETNGTSTLEFSPTPWPCWYILGGIHFCGEMLVKVHVCNTGSWGGEYELQFLFHPSLDSCVWNFSSVVFKMGEKIMLCVFEVCVPISNVSFSCK